MTWGCCPPWPLSAYSRVRRALRLALPCCIRVTLNLDLSPHLNHPLGGDLEVIRGIICAPCQYDEQEVLPMRHRGGLSAGASENNSPGVNYFCGLLTYQGRLSI